MKGLYKYCISNIHFNILYSLFLLKLNFNKIVHFQFLDIANK